MHKLKIPCKSDSNDKVDSYKYKLDVLGPSNNNIASALRSNCTKK